MKSTASQKISEQHVITFKEKYKGIEKQERASSLFSMASSILSQSSHT